MQLSRRSFLASLIAAVVMAPIVCRFKQAVEVKTPEPDVTAMQSTWDGRLSPNFLRKYKLPPGTLSQKQIKDITCS